MKSTTITLLLLSAIAAISAQFYYEAITLISVAGLLHWAACGGIK